MGGAQRALRKRKRNPVEMQKLFFAKMAQRRRVAEHQESKQHEEFLAFSNTTEDAPETSDKASDTHAQQKMSRDELALMTPQQAATINNELGQVLSVWLES